MKLTPTEPDIRTLVDRIDRGDIDLQPEFQRQEVWPTRKKKRLIDTVLRGWSIPPVHLVETSDSRMEVLDGQQRLAAIRDFLHNRFSIDGGVMPDDKRIQNLGGKFYKSLDQATRRQVDQYALRCFRITDYAPEEPSELFYRLNQPTSLTSGEQRNALYGPARAQLKEIVTEFESQGNDKSSLGFSNLRLAYDDIFARLLFFLELSSFGVKSTETLVSDRFRRTDEFSSRVWNRAITATTQFTHQRSIARPYRFNKANVLSWLLFFSRFDEEEAEPMFMESFFSIEESGVDQDGLLACFQTFQDRSSQRVTDVSSVTYRDFCLTYAYRFLNMGPLPRDVREEYLEQVQSAVRGSISSFEGALEEFVDIDDWSSSL